MDKGKFSFTEKGKVIIGYSFYGDVFDVFRVADNGGYLLVQDVPEDARVRKVVRINGEDSWLAYATTAPRVDENGRIYSPAGEMDRFSELPMHRVEDFCRWVEGKNLPTITRYMEKGMGYDGGHNHGYPTSLPHPQETALVWTSDMNYGHCTGCHPYTISYVPAC